MRRRSFRRFRRGKPLQRVNYGWANTIFNESALDPGGLPTEFVLFDVGDWANLGAAQTSRETCLVERIIMSGSLTWIPQSTTLASNMVGVGFGMYVQDVDDTDSDLWSTTSANSVVRSATRYLWSKYRQLTVIENTGNLNASSGSPNQLEVEVDIKVKVKVGLEDLIILAGSFGSDSSSTVSLAAFTGQSRVLYRIP